MLTSHRITMRRCAVLLLFWVQRGVEPARLSDSQFLSTAARQTKFEIEEWLMQDSDVQSADAYAKSPVLRSVSRTLDMSASSTERSDENGDKA